MRATQLLPMALFPLSIVTALPLFATACGDDDSDTGAQADADGGADGGAEADYAANVTIADFLTRDPVEGVEFEIDGEVYTSDAGGSIDFVLPGGSYDATATHPDYPGTYWTFSEINAGFSLSTYLVDRGTASAIMGALGMSLDSSKGVVVVSVFGEGGFAEGVTVDLDAGYEGVIVADSSSSVGFGVGNTTLAGSSGWVVFLNVDAGSITPTLDTGDGRSCAAWPGQVDSSMTADLLADSVYHLTFDCE